MSYEEKRKDLCLPWVESLEVDGAYSGTRTWIRDVNGKGVAKTTNQIRSHVFNRHKAECVGMAEFIVHACNNYHLMEKGLQTLHEMLVCMKNGVDMPNDFILKTESATRKLIKSLSLDKPEPGDDEHPSLFEEGWHEG